MACIIKGKITKKRIMVLSGAASGLAVALYLVSTVTHNLAISTTMSALLSTAACPAMCVGMCGVFFLANHLSGKNCKKNQMLEKDVKI
ncbi:MAG: hypothetical protein WBF33_09125 [Candidatus Nitrosopolaris sp.]